MDRRGELGYRRTMLVERRGAESSEPPTPTRTPTPPPASAVVARGVDDPGEASVEAIALARALGVSITMADALHRAGRGGDDLTRRFLDPKLVHLTPPDAMLDRDAGAERVARAVRA